ncbi:hypothetical protein TTRE_0000390101 [Trichuris trichiura]|uniref:Uncharacterized protein n=1 Tax=Trichuris trichiura TaxID=36087 RepID=A0A077Z7P6_TRITR|nr:hypothetical protein TTRE_0000390101 [Trichuris trichiura]
MQIYVECIALSGRKSFDLNGAVQVGPIGNDNLRAWWWSRNVQSNNGPLETNIQDGRRRVVEPEADDSFTGFLASLCLAAAPQAENRSGP